MVDLGHLLAYTIFKCESFTTGGYFDMPIKEINEVRKTEEWKVPFILLFTIFLIDYVLAYFLGRVFRHLIPKGKELEVGLACGIGIMIIFFMTKMLWFPSDNNGLFFTIGFGLSSGLTSSITSYGKIRK